MQDVYEVADVVFNYSSANIPLETMWTDIDYMDLRKVFTLDPDRFPLEKVRELVTYLHDHDQHYIMMVDPAVAYQDYPPFNNGVDVSAFMRMENGSIFKGKKHHFSKPWSTHKYVQVWSGLASPHSQTGSIRTPKIIGTTNSQHFLMLRLV